ncbi:hypothetical protein FJ444_12545 [Aestuariibacter sp. GS-14]|nr:hypothetical protein FJ444_12545 [Aestuariibacter sp. GS-14]
MSRQNWLCKMVLAIAVSSIANCVSAFADPIAVVVPQKSEISELTKKQVIDIFMGRFDLLESGQRIKPVDYNNGYEFREQFYRALLDKSERQVAAYWSRLLFSGRAKPPIQVPSVQNSIEELSSDASMITYIPITMVSEEMKIVLVLE